MRNKFLGTGEPGYHPLRKLAVVLAGLRYAALHDFSVLYKAVLSVLVLGLALWLRAWVDAAVILLATGVVLAAELFNRQAGSRLRWIVRLHKILHTLQTHAGHARSGRELRQASRGPFAQAREPALTDWLSPSAWLAWWQASRRGAQPFAAPVHGSQAQSVLGDRHHLHPHSRGLLEKTVLAYQVFRLLVVGQQAGQQFLRYFVLLGCHCVCGQAGSRLRWIVRLHKILHTLLGKPETVSRDVVVKARI